MRTLVLGLGNEYAGDDAVGVLAVRALHDELAGEADVVESSASGLALLEVFAGDDRAVVVDSIRTGRAPAGTIVKTGLAELGPATAPSLHQTGIPELAAVARRLGMGFPDRTRVLAVEVAGPLMFGAPLSEPVAAAIAPLGRCVLEQAKHWASEDSCRPGLGAHAVSQDREREAVHTALLCTARPQKVRARWQHVLADTGALARDGACSITPVAGEAPTVGAPVVVGRRQGGGVTNVVGAAAHNSLARLRSGAAEKRGLQFPGMRQVCSRPGRPDYAVLVSGTEPADG